MNKPVSAEEFFNQFLKINKLPKEELSDVGKLVMIDFAQQWVECTKQECAEKAVAKLDEHRGKIYGVYVDKQSILNAVKTEEVI